MAAWTLSRLVLVCVRVIYSKELQVQQCFWGWRVKGFTCLRVRPSGGYTNQQFCRKPFKRSYTTANMHLGGRHISDWASSICLFDKWSIFIYIDIYIYICRCFLFFYPSYKLYRQHIWLSIYLCLLDHVLFPEVPFLTLDDLIFVYSLRHEEQIYLAVDVYFKCIHRDD